eukprot:g31946.t1
MPADFVMRLCIDPRDPEGAANRRVAISDAWDKQWPNDALIDRALFTINGCIFFTMMMGVMNICMAASMGIPTRLPTLIREHRNGAYGVPAMYLSKA